MAPVVESGFEDSKGILKGMLCSGIGYKVNLVT